MFRVFILLILFSFTGCSKNDSLSKPLVIVSIEPYEYLVKKIADDTVEIRSLIPASANVHSYEPTPQKIHELIKAQIWFQLGEPLEINIEPSIQQKNNSLIIYDLKTGIELIDDHCSVTHDISCKDLHIWLSPILMKRQALGIGKILMDRFPENISFYRKNLQNLLLELDELNSFIEKTLDPLDKRVLLVTHPAFGYFCRDYDCLQISIEFEGKDPLPRKLNEVLAMAKQYDAKALIYLPQFSQKSAAIVSRSLGISMYVFNPYEKDYIQNMKHLAELVVVSNE